MTDPALLKDSGIVLHPSIEHVLQWFSYDHLPEQLQAYSKLFHDLALQVAYSSPQSQETTIALRKLLEAKDAAIRSAIHETK